MKPVRIFTTYPSDDASRRLRIDPMVKVMRREGRQVTVHTLLTSAMFREKNIRRRRPLVAAKLVARLASRCYELATVSGSEQVIVHREAFPFFTPVAERWLGHRAAMTVLDVDDALYADPTHARDWRRLLRSASAYDSVLESVDLVLAGSPSLCRRATALGTPANLTYTIPPPAARKLQRERAEKPTLVWTGSQSTLGSLLGILDDALAVCEEIDGHLLVLGGPNIAELPYHPRLQARRWSQERELQALRSAWLGLMPLPDTPWEAGKSAYKLLLYLFAGLPVIASPVGMNRCFAGAPGVTLVEESQGWAAAMRTGLRNAPQEDGDSIRNWVEALVRPDEQLESVPKMLDGSDVSRNECDRSRFSPPSAGAAPARGDTER